MKRTFESPESKDGELPLTQHAALRKEERKISTEACDIVLAHGDLQTLTRGCERWRLSRRVGRRLERQGCYARHYIVEAREAELILAPDGRIITMYRHAADLRFRRSGVRPDSRRFWRNPEKAE